MKEQKKERDIFASKWGFILAAAGGAVGMGNVWAFPYRTATYGGAAFLLIYIACILIFARTGVVSEIAMGRWARGGPIEAMSKAGGKPIYRYLGYIPVFTSFCMATGYAVIMGWVVRYFLGSITGDVLAAHNTGAYFGAICGAFGSLPWHMLALLTTALIMVGGISGSIERINKYIMPLFFIMFLGMALYVLTLAGASEGYKYLFIPRWEHLLNIKTWVYALGQAFFSLSLAGFGELIYGSYLKDDEDIPKCSDNIVIFDTIAALLAACVVIPAVFAFHKDLAAGPPLIFITLPTIFQEMGSLGYVFAIIFFAAVLFAAATTMLNLFEPCFELLERYGFTRRKAAFILIPLSAIVGVFLEDASYVGPWMDIVSIYFCPIGALLVSICFYWIMDEKVAMEQINLGAKDKFPAWQFALGKYVYCATSLIVIILGIAMGGI